MNERTSEYIMRAYTSACNHGFHDKELSVEHLIMLVLTEVSEMVEADRKGLHANMSMFIRESSTLPPRGHEENHWQSCFERFIKDTVEDEMADVCIRLFDFCGTFGLDASIIVDNDLLSEYRCLFGGKSFCEQCFTLCSVLCRIDGLSFEDDSEDDDTIDNIPTIISGALTFIYFMAKELHVDLARHIDLKMSYNELRPRKHGKCY